MIEDDGAEIDPAVATKLSAAARGFVYISGDGGVCPGRGKLPEMLGKCVTYSFTVLELDVSKWLLSGQRGQDGEGIVAALQGWNGEGRSGRGGVLGERGEEGE